MVKKKKEKEKAQSRVSFVGFPSQRPSFGLLMTRPHRERSSSLLGGHEAGMC